MLRLLADENFNRDLVRGLLRHRPHFDIVRAQDGLIVITLDGGCEFAFPVAVTEGLADAPRSKLTKIKISPNGLGLHWPLLDADLYVPALIEGASCSSDSI